MQKKLFPLILLFLASFLVETASAEPFNLMQVPTYVDDQLGTGLFIAGLIVSLALELFVLLPVMLMTKGKAVSVYLILFFAVAAPLVGLGWFPVWLYIILLLAIALGFGQKLRDYLGGFRR